MMAKPVPWSIRAAQRLWDEMEDIDEDAGQAGHANQDGNAEMEEWISTVAEIIEDEYLGHVGIEREEWGESGF